MIRSLGYSNGPTNSGIYYRMFKKSCPIFRVYNILYQNCQDFKTTELSFYSGQFLWIIIIIRNLVLWTLWNNVRYHLTEFLHKKVLKYESTIILSVQKFTEKLYCFCLSISIPHIYTEADAVQICGKFWDTQYVGV